MKTPKSLFVMALLGLQITSTAQVQWYQNQDGDGTSANSILPLTKRSFIASYFWSIEGSNYTWKVSKSNFNGEELKTFFVSGTGANIDIKTGAKNSIFILVRNYDSYIYPENTIYKLDTNLNIIKQKLISIPNGFGIYSVNAFDVDEDNNIYLVGDGVQNSETNPASFVMKLNKNLVNSWTRIDAIPTTYSDVHTDHNGSLFVISDDYAINPDLPYMKVRAFNGGLLRKDTVHFNFTRWSLSSQVDGNGDLILYGIKAANSFDQSVYLCKLSGRRGNIFFRKEYFSSISTQLQDFKLDREGNMYALISHFYLPDSTVCSVSRISRFNGWTNWNHSFTMSRDSTNFLKLVNNDRDFIYAVGEKKC
ncbi:MAG: hypothetical protein JSU05_03505, partial [Bacteroidetes bacterium]|nr:hypothetical protein [Bacteroidota bacterium]